MADNARAKRTDRVTDIDSLRETFGAERVDEQGRRDAVRSLFNRIASRYDLMNDLMSFGLHRLWKRSMIKVALKRLDGFDGPLVDLAGGTGDIAFGIHAADPERKVIIADASEGMLEIARRRGGDSVDYLLAEAEDMPLEDGLAGAITLAFGLRNMTDPARALTEAARILTPGASLVLLEFSKPARWFAPFYGLHSRFVIPAIGAMVARDRGAYTYLVDSISLFPAADDVTRALDNAGLRTVEQRAFMFGVAVLHVAVKK